MLDLIIIGGSVPILFLDEVEITKSRILDFCKQKSGLTR